MATLSIAIGAAPGTTVELNDDKIVLGRAETCTIVLNVPAVSREHAVIRKIQGEFYIENLGRNSTFLNNKEVTARTLLKDEDRIKICDFVLKYSEKAHDGTVEEVTHRRFSTIEAALPPTALITQPSDELAMLLNLGSDFANTFDVDELLPRVVDMLFQVFHQADSGLIILEVDGRLIPKVTKRRGFDDKTEIRFSRRNVQRCIETGQALLSEYVSADKRIDMSQSIADCSVMCVPLVSRATGKAFGVIQVHTHSRLLKFTQDDLKLLLSVAEQAAVALENARLHVENARLHGLQRDLRLAHQVQQSLLPKAFPQEKGYEFWAHYESASEVGGDYYDFIRMPGGRLSVMIGDVAGKGVPAALLMAKVCSDARFTMLTEDNLGDAISKLNDLMQEAGTLDRFVTLGASLIDLNTHEVTFANAMHIPPLVYRYATKEFFEPVTSALSGLPLGVGEGLVYETCSIILNPGDTVLLFTDGVTEAKNTDGADFGMVGVRSALCDGPMGPKTMGQRIVAAVKQHSLGCAQYDDLTVVTFGRQADETIGPSSEALARHCPADLVALRAQSGQRFTKIEFPPVCWFGEQAVLKVQLTIAQTDSMILPGLENVTEKGETILSVHVTATGFEMRPFSKPMRVPVDGDSDEVVFLMTPVDQNNPVIEIELFFGCERVGYCTVVTEIRAHD